MATQQPSKEAPSKEAPSKEAQCSIAAYLKLAAANEKLPNDFITNDKNLVVGDGNCDTRKSSDNSCECDEETLDLSTYKRDAWVSAGMVLNTNLNFVNEMKH